MIRRIKNFLHLIIALIANILYSFPSRSMKIIGVTGTDGKTTTATLIYEILREAGKKVAILSTVSAVIDGKFYDTGFHVTTPNSFSLQKYLMLAKKANVEFFILETTSHGLDQNRVYGIHYAVSAITNISNEHLDYHKTYENYVAAKAKIISMSDKVVLNKDDQSFPYLQKFLTKKTALTYSLAQNADYSLEKYPLSPNLPGKFNLYNALAALGVCMELGLSFEECKKVINNFKTPTGRQQILQESPYTVMIDFAHTPNSFSALLSTLRNQYKGRVIHIFGSAGQRDTEKRPEMGMISSQYSDVVVLTAEDPRGESVEEINKDIKTKISGFISLDADDALSGQVNLSMDKKYIIETSDRRQAIKIGLSLAKKDDIVVITGKGHEQSMNFGSGEEHWSDHEVVEELLSKK